MSKSWCEHGARNHYNQEININTGFRLTIVTSLYGDYGKFLPDWTKSVCGLTGADRAAHLAGVVVVISGKTPPELDAEKIFSEQCVPLLEYSDINYKLITLPEHISMGRARNKAVSAAGTEWVQYLDVDDTIMTHALADFAEIAAAGEDSGRPVDVISAGIRYGADRAGDPDRLFTGVSAEKALAGQTVSFSLSPFRKRLWQVCPYIEANDHIDSALWVGFAHQCAVFAATKRACVTYRKRTDGHNLTRSEKDRRQAGEQLLSLCRDASLFERLRLDKDGRPVRMVVGDKNEKEGFSKMKLNPKYRLITGKLTRYINGARVRIRAGEAGSTFRPTDDELKSFGDLLEQVNPGEQAVHVQSQSPSNKMPAVTATAKATTPPRELKIAIPAAALSDTSLTMVTSLHGDYGKYLPAWANSIAALKTAPDAVIVVISGRTPNNAEDIFTRLCAPALKSRGIPFRLLQMKSHYSMGNARNAAVAAARTEWVQFLDVDDVVLPNFVDDFRAFLKERDYRVDVASIGVRFGAEFAARNPDIFADASAALALSLPRRRVSTSLSPFRKRLWQSRPYIEDPNVNFIDGALWIGFAHLGARIVGMDTICAEYRLRKDGHFHSLTNEEVKASVAQLSRLIADESLFERYQAAAVNSDATVRIAWAATDIAGQANSSTPGQATVQPATAPVAYQPDIKPIGGSWYLTPGGKKYQGKRKALEAAIEEYNKQKAPAPSQPDPVKKNDKNSAAKPAIQPDQSDRQLDNRAESLKKIKSILNAAVIPAQEKGRPGRKATWFVSNGTALGAVREKDFIRHDGDVDIIMLSEEWPQSSRDELTDTLKRQGFEFKLSHTSDHMRLTYKGGWLCFYFYRIDDNDPRLRVAASTKWASNEAAYYVPAALLEGDDYRGGAKEFASIRGQLYPVPAPASIYLEWQYGPEKVWRVPNRQKGYRNFAETRTCVRAAAVQAVDGFALRATKTAGI